MDWKRWLYKLAKYFYALKEQAVEKCDVVVPTAYGLTRDGKLPDAEEDILSRAALIAKKSTAPIIWGSTEMFFPGSKVMEDRRKQGYLKIIGYNDSVFILEKPVCNSVEEAMTIREYLVSHNLPHRFVVVISDWPHTRSIRRIYKKVFSDSNFVFLSEEGKWKPPMYVRFQESELLWLMACLLRHIVLVLFGINWVAKIRHPLH